MAIVKHFGRATKRRNFRSLADSIHEKFYFQTNGTHVEHTLNMCLLGVSTHKIATAPNVEPKPEKNRLQKFISSIALMWKNSLNSTVKLFFKSDQKWRSYRHKTVSNGVSRHTKSKKCTINPVIYGGSVRSWWISDSVVKKKFLKFLTKAEPEPKVVEFQVSCTQPIG